MAIESREALSAMTAQPPSTLFIFRVNVFQGPRVVPTWCKHPRCRTESQPPDGSLYLIVAIRSRALEKLLEATMTASPWFHPVAFNNVGLAYSSSALMRHGCSQSNMAIQDC